jgi:hypothetical protein
MKKSIPVITFLVISSFFFIFSCTKDDDGMGERGILSLKITDAPSDDDHIKGIFITIAGINVNGKPIRTFIPQTIEISSYNNGKTKLILEKELASKDYRHLTLLLDKKKNDSGEAPGNYVLTDDNMKHDLFEQVSSSGEIDIIKDFEILPGAETRLVIDFDLRKAVVHDENVTGNTYRFADKNGLQQAVRLVDESKTGNITGRVYKRGKDDERMFVLLYRKGEFDDFKETSERKILFPGSVSSARIDQDGNYRLSFIEEGEYEIQVASFKNSGNGYHFNGFLKTTSRRTGTLLNDISVSAGSELELNIEVFTLI